ncbi:MAG: peptide deformylase [Lachnospiraceae bacterium]|nr:peptide deformylase [Ruminococcus sp.]MCM1273892.1 peptide deformylase [Lachnospiraceae bacterium]
MALREIVKFGEDILRKKCREVTSFDEKLAILLDDMKETLQTADGVGLAAPQVGLLRRVVVVDIRDGKGAIELVNPVLVEQFGNQVGNEGCLSAPGEWCEVERPMRVTVKAFDRHGKEITVKGSGLLARALCHELDHLEGILFTDRVKQDIPERAEARR